ncbi:MAG: heavy metal-binding domain-containing protein [Bacteroidota bacterium]
MKSIKLLLVTFVAILSFSVSAQTKETAKKAESAKCSCTKCGCAKGKCDCTTTSCKCSSCSKEGKNGKVSTNKYSCPMHADITSDKPGKCSKCGMDLKANKG